MADNELEELDQLYAQGVLTDAELHNARQRVFERDAVPTTDDAAAESEAGSGRHGVTGEHGVTSGDDGTADDDGPDQHLPAPGSRRWLRWWPLAALLVGIVLIVLAVVPFHSGKSSKIAVNGVVAVINHDVTQPDDTTGLEQGSKFGTGGFNIGKGCHTTPGTGYADLVGGATVVITDGSGTNLASTVLRAGVYDANADCVFGFGTVVARGKSTYDIIVGKRAPTVVTGALIATPQLAIH